jgi:predicted dehydrogenase
MSAKTRVGIIGCGTISDIYFQAGQTFEILDIVACADLVSASAQAKADKYGVQAMSVAELLADPTIEIIINLTIPKAHAEIALAALQAGKSVYNEKPLALKREDAQELLALAKARGLLIGGAPDTFLGGGIQTCRQLIDDRAIGVPIGGSAAMLNHGPEGWHPNPDFFYQVGGGPMFDMGPYYLTALVALLGPIQRICGSARISLPERTIASAARAGQKIVVEIPTHIAGVLDFVNGAIVTMTTSFDVWANELPRIEIYGTEGTLSLPDPNTFGGPVRLRRARESQWQDIPVEREYTQNSRGLGVADMAYALRSGRPARANGALTYHVLDAMHAFHDASNSGQYVSLASTCERPAALSAGILDS